jgi:hypothetical protein
MSGAGDGYCTSGEWGFLILILKNSDNHGEGDLLPWIMNIWILKILGFRIRVREEEMSIQVG